ncbi:MAG TPA: response regulator transcription factor [Candidatus Limnocylindria bacterium]
MVASAPRRVRILVADDHPSIRENLRYLLNDEDDFEVVGVARDGGEALATTIALEPDVVVLDESMPVMPGSAVVAQLRERGVASRVVMYTSEPGVCERALAAGADRCVGKEQPMELLFAAIRECVPAPRRT